MPGEAERQTGMKKKIKRGTSGKLILRSIPTEEAKSRVVAILQKLTKNATPEQIRAKIRRTPTILVSRIAVEKAERIVEAFEKAGANAAFVPLRPGELKTSEAGTTAPRVIERPVEIVPPPGRTLRKWLRGTGAVLALVVSLGFLVLEVFPIGYKGGIYRVRQPEPIDFTEFHPVTAPIPNLQGIHPRQMQNAFRFAYRPRPDKRLILPFQILAERFNALRGIPLEPSPFRSGEILSDGKSVIIPLLKDGRTLTEIRMRLPLSFRETLQALDRWLAAMEAETTGALKEPADDRRRSPTIREAAAAVESIDPRTIMNGLSRLESLWNEIGPDADILEAAARGYARLVFVLVPDRMDAADALAARGLSLLAAARHAAPNAHLDRSEGLMALVMGYSNEAVEALGKGRDKADRRSDELLKAYAMRDLAMVNRSGDPARSPLGGYLSVRLYRILGFQAGARRRARELLARFPDSYTALVESIYSAGPEDADNSSLKYLQALLADVLPAPKEMGAGKGKDRRPARIEPVPFSRFEDFLKQNPAAETGPIFGGPEIRSVYRALYAGAVFLRFNYLLNRIGAVENAAAFLNEIAAGQDDLPLVMAMKAELLTRSGNRTEAERLAAKVVLHPDTSPRLALFGWYLSDDSDHRLRLAALAIDRMDSRPEYLLFMTHVFQGIWHYDLAQRRLSLALAQNSFLFEGYPQLTRILGSPAPLAEAAQRFPYSAWLREKAGDFFSARADRNSLEKALEFYRAAIDLMPENYALAAKIADTLDGLDRPADAIEMLTDWLRTNRPAESAAERLRFQKAALYFRLKQPRLALKLVAPQLSRGVPEAMILTARAYEVLGNYAKAHKAQSEMIARYPGQREVLTANAAYNWRMGRYRIAGQRVAAARPVMGTSSMWYMDAFMEAVGRATEENVVKATEALIDSGAGASEIRSLAFRFEDAGRPQVTLRLLERAAAMETEPPVDDIAESVRIIRDSKGGDAARIFLQEAGSGQNRVDLIGSLCRQGLFDQVLALLEDPASYPVDKKEYFWLQRLVAWLFLDRNPPQLEKAFVDHYRGTLFQRQRAKITGRISLDPYHAVGRYLIELDNQGTLLSTAATDRQRALLAYYAGVDARLAGRFSDASDWYEICRELRRENTDEFRRASDELFWWAHIGIRHRHRQVSADISAYKHRKKGR